MKILKTCRALLSTVYPRTGSLLASVVLAVLTAPTARVGRGCVGTFGRGPGLLCVLGITCAPRLPARGSRGWWGVVPAGEA